MAIIYSYPQGTPTLGDNVIGSQIDPITEENKTVQFTVGQIAGFANSYSLGYTVYTALLTQTGALPANVPVATILQNTTGGTITWTRTAGNAAGEYTATITGAFFTLNKTIVFINNGSSSSTANIEWRNPTTSTISIDTTGNSVLTGASIEIRVYA